MNLAIGLFYLHAGISIFVAQSTLKLKLEVIYRGIVRSSSSLAALVLITFVPRDLLTE